MPSPAGAANADVIESRTFEELKVGDANASGACLISAPSSRVAVRVIPTDEEHMIALHARAAIAAG